MIFEPSASGTIRIRVTRGNKARSLSCGHASLGENVLRDGVVASQQAVTREPQNKRRMGATHAPSLLPLQSLDVQVLYVERVFFDEAAA